jgi:hypothetical protein
VIATLIALPEFAGACSSKNVGHRVDNTTSSATAHPTCASFSASKFSGDRLLQTPSNRRHALGSTAGRLSVYTDKRSLSRI